jgi:hypothetical protein
MRKREQSAVVITRMGRRNRLVEMPWLENDFDIDQSDWVVLSNDGWCGVVDGEPQIWDALQRKLLIGIYLNQPVLIAVIGHGCGRGDDAGGPERGKGEVRRILRRIRSYHLPVAVLGFWTDTDGWLEDAVDDDDDGDAGVAAERDSIMA